MGFLGSLAAAKFKSSTSGFKENMRESVRNLTGNGDTVNWEDYNYPPCLRVVHFDLNDVEDPTARVAVQWAHAYFIIVQVLLLVNLVVTVALAAGGVSGKGVHVLYSFFNVIIVTIVGMYGFYNGYKGLATQNMRLTSRYLLIEAAVGVFVLVSMLAGGSNFNGWMNLERADEASDMRDFWVPWTYTEASLWTATFLVGVVAWARVAASRRYGRPTGGGFRARA
mmetsp:Transcript_23796/g.81105  ORF Transcript_23796/g.81105 Transcript_23796/m.81105 type:complete len:224 (+) Transcript_23796:98-769(+)